MHYYKVLVFKSLSFLPMKPSELNCFYSLIEALSSNLWTLVIHFIQLNSIIYYFKYEYSSGHQLLVFSLSSHSGMYVHRISTSMLWFYKSDKHYQKPILFVMRSDVRVTFKGLKCIVSPSGINVNLISLFWIILF